MTFRQHAKQFLVILALSIGGLSCVGAAAGDDTTATAAPVTAQPASALTTATSGTGLSASISGAQSDVQKLKQAQPDLPTAAAASDLLNEAAEQVRLRDRFTSETQEHESAVREAPAQLQTVRSELELDDSATTHVDVPTTASFEQVDQALATRRAELKGLQDQLGHVQLEQQKKTTRAEAIPREIVEAKHKQSAASIALQSGPGTDDPLVANARQILSRARLASADAQTSALQAEQMRYQARDELLPLARQLIAQRIDRHQTEIAALETRLADFRRAEATATARQLNQTARETVTSHPLVRRVAAESTSISSEMNLGALVELQDKAQERLSTVRKQVDQTSSTFNSLRVKFQSVGYSDALGIMLRRQRKELPSLRAHREELQTLGTRLADVNLQLLEGQDRVNELANPEALARALLAGSSVDTATTGGRAVRSEVSQLLQARRDYLVKVVDGYEKLFQTLVDLNATEQALVEVSSAFKAFIDERIFWLPSTDRFSVDSVRLALGAFSDVFRPSLAWNYWKAFQAKGRSQPVTYVLGAMLLLLVVFAHHRWKRSLRAWLDHAGQSRLAGFSPLAWSVFYTALYILPAPLFLILLGLPLARVLLVPVAVSSLAEGLIAGGLALFVVRFAQVLTRHKGTVEVFFVWQESAAQRVSRIFSVLALMYVPAVILLQTWQTADTDAGMEAARLVLVAVLAGVGLLAGQLFWPGKSVLTGTSVSRPGSIVHRLRYLLFAVVVGAPAVLIVAALMGYYYTAFQLSARLNISAWIGLGLVLVSETAFFWILVSRRRLAIEEARKRRDAARAQQTSDGDAQGEPPSVPAEPALDIASISSQAGRLLRVAVLGIFVLALWGIWAEVLPALHYLDSLTVWNVSRTINEIDPGTGTIHTVERLVPITLVSLLVAFFVITALVVALRNIPGLLDISVYQRYGVQTGEKYAFNTLIRYLLIILAVTWVLYLLGLQWKQIQWLVAAVSVGLGFGLQEIFANFVSGLILLFERPIRVGDVVTVGDQSGRVAQIRIRATTVVNWDHKILIIPNKELITKSVVNWTLLNSMQRLVITVSVEHGADYDAAREILLRAAKECPYALTDPAPQAAIDKTTLTSVDFMLLVHLPNGDNAMDAKHGIIARIEREFQTAGIRLAVARMDVRVVDTGR